MILKWHSVLLPYRRNVQSSWVAKPLATRFWQFPQTIFQNNGAENTIHVMDIIIPEIFFCGKTFAATKTAIVHLQTMHFTRWILHALEDILAVHL